MRIHTFRLVPALMLVAGSVLAAAAGQTGQIEAVARSGSVAEFSRLLAGLDAKGASRLKARALMLRCQGQLGADLAAARAAAAAGIPVATASAADAELGGLLLCRGYIEELSGHGERAHADYDAAIAASTRSGDRAGAAQATVLRGEIQHGRGRYAEALQDMQSAYRAYLDLGNEKQLSYSLNAIANLYADPRVGQYGQALDYYRQLLQRHQVAGNRGEMATAHYNIGSTLRRLERYPEALDSFRAALSAYGAGQDADSVAETRRAMAALLLQMGRPADALPLAEQALRHALRAGDVEFTARVRLTRARPCSGWDEPPRRWPTWRWRTGSSRRKTTSVSSNTPPAC